MKFLRAKVENSPMWFALGHCFHAVTLMAIWVLESNTHALGGDAMLQLKTESPEINPACAKNLILNWEIIDQIAKELTSETDEDRFELLTRRLFDVLGEA